MIELLIHLLILLIIFGLLYYVVTLLPLPQPFKNIAVVILLLIVVVVLLGYLAGYPLPRLTR